MVKVKTQTEEKIYEDSDYLKYIAEESKTFDEWLNS